MIQNNLLKKIPTGNGVNIYEFIPSPFRLFYHNYEPMTLPKYIRFLEELTKKDGYRVYYLAIGDDIVAYTVVSQGGRRYSFAQPDDIVVGPYFVLEAYRGNKYSELLVSEVLRYRSFRYAYDWIKKDNVPSIKCAERVGFKQIGTLDLIGVTKRMKTHNDNSGEYLLFRLEKSFVESENRLYI